MDSESLLRSTLLKDDLNSRAGSVKRPRQPVVPAPLAVVAFFADEDEDMETETTESAFLARRLTGKYRKRASMPASAPVGGIFGWLWRENEEEESNALTRSPSLTRSRPATPSRTGTPSSLPETSAIQFCPRTMHIRHGWSAEIVPRLDRPASPVFDARHASKQCKDIDGYVSFGAIEGLGMPPMDDDIDTDGRKSSKSSWWPWKQP